MAADGLPNFHDSSEDTEDGRESASETPPCCLTRLPLELRHMTYSFILPHDQIIKPNVGILFRDASGHENGKRPFPSHEHTLALARTCRQLHSEVIAFYYRRNTLNFISVYDMYRYLYMIGLERRRYITAIQVFLVETNYVSKWSGRRGRGTKAIKYEKVQRWAFELLRDAGGLKRLWLGMQVLGVPSLKLTLKEFLHRDVWDYWEARKGLEVTIAHAWFSGRPWGSEWSARWEFDGRR